MTDTKIPIEELKKRAAEGDQAANRSLGLLYELGLDTGVAADPNWIEAKKHWEQAAIGGDPWAQFTMGEITARGLDGSVPNIGTAAAWFSKAKATGFVLPSEKLSALKNEPAAPSGSVKGRTVLIVDDSKPARLMIRSTLEGAGYAVVEATSGVEAWEKLQSDWNISLVLTDVNHKDLKTLELIEKIHSSNKFPDVAVVVITAENKADVVRNAKQFGVKGWLVKPVSPQTLEQTAKKFLGK